MPKLKYKKKEKEEKKKHKKRKHKKHHHSYYSPPTIYEEEEGTSFPSQASKYQYEEEEEWRQKLFDAMRDDEQDTYHTSFYSEPSNPRNKNDIHQMTEEEYRIYIQQGIYEKKHAQEIKEKKQRQKEKEKKEKEKEQQRKQLEQEIEKERQRYQKGLEKEKEQQYEKSYQHYCALWDQLLNKKEGKEENPLIVTKRNIPWPSVHPHQITFHHVQLFVSRFIKTKKQFRQEQLKYHPDKFIPKIKPYFLKGAEKDLDWIIQKNNEVSGWLNQLWLEYKDKLA
ncbi:unnamed protein product [Cunninghamella blakesleeana]